MVLRYKWLHIPTGATGIREFEELYVGHLKEMLDEWNRQGDVLWKYWGYDK